MRTSIVILSMKVHVVVLEKIP